MHKIEIVVNFPNSQGLRDTLDLVLRHALEVLNILGLNAQGIAMYDIPEEKEEENVG